MNRTISLLALLILVNAGIAQTVTIGSQVWMTKNLNVVKFRNGDPIPQAKTEEEWFLASKKRQPAWCFYNNDSTNDAVYGKLYNWFAVNDSRGLAPKGFHIPSEKEWDTLIQNSGGYSLAGGELKSTNGWTSYTDEKKDRCLNCASWSDDYRKKSMCNNCKNTRRILVSSTTRSGNGTNSSGFSALPGGRRTSRGGFPYTPYLVGQNGSWWSSTEFYLPELQEDLSDVNSLASCYELFWVRRDVAKEYQTNMGEGLSVRCIKDK